MGGKLRKFYSDPSFTFKLYKYLGKEFLNFWEEFHLDNRDTAVQMSRITGHASGASMVAGQPVAAVPLAAFATVMDLYTIFVDVSYGSSLDAVNTAGAMALSAGTQYARNNFVQMLPGPAKTPVTIFMTVGDRATQEVIYQVGK